MFRAHKVFLATAYPQSELVRTMKRLLACLALCASLSASAQDDNCTVLPVQELSLAYQDLNASIDSIMVSLQSLNDRVIVEYTVCWGYASGWDNELTQCVNDSLDAGWSLYGGIGGGGGGGGYHTQALVKYADD